MTAGAGRGDAIVAAIDKGRKIVWNNVVDKGQDDIQDEEIGLEGNNESETTQSKLNILYLWTAPPTLFLSVEYGTWYLVVTVIITEDTEDPIILGNLRFVCPLSIVHCGSSIHLPTGL